MPTSFCRHIRINGRRCCSPALRTSAYCYYHSTSLQRHRNLTPTQRDATPTIIHPLNADNHHQREPILAEPAAPETPLHLDFPALDDRESIQVALSMLISALGKDRIDGKRAAPMLYALQVASSNAAKLDLNPRANQLVTDTIIDEDGFELAPDEDPAEVIEFRRWLAQHRIPRQSSAIAQPPGVAAA